MTVTVSDSRFTGSLVVDISHPTNASHCRKILNKVQAKIVRKLASVRIIRNEMVITDEGPPLKAWKRWEYVKAKNAVEYVEGVIAAIPHFPDEDDNEPLRMEATMTKKIDPKKYLEEYFSNSLDPYAPAFNDWDPEKQLYFTTLVKITGWAESRTNSIVVAEERASRIGKMLMEAEFGLWEDEVEFVAEVKGLVQRKAGTAEEAMLELAEWIGKEI